MLSVDFQADKVVITKAAMGGALNVAIDYNKFPSIRDMPVAELEELGYALGLAIANIDFQVSRIGLQAHIKLLEEKDSAGLIVPDNQLVVP